MAKSSVDIDLELEYTDEDTTRGSQLHIDENGHITMMHIGSISLRGIMEELVALTELKNLSFHSTILGQVPESFTALSKLEILGLQTNMLKSLPNNFGELTHLRKLDLSFNQLSSLPESISQLDHLETLGTRSQLFHHGPRLYSIFDGIKIITSHGKSPSGFARLDAPSSPITGLV